MNESVAVIIPTFGDQSWRVIAQRAMDSVLRQTRKPDIIMHCIGDNLMTARNKGAAIVSSKWLIFLDADDELDEHYVEAMVAGEGDVRYPRICYVDWPGQDPDRIREITSPHILQQNMCVIGSMVRRDLFLEVGGFEDQPIWEDWIFWIKCWKAGADFRLCRDAIYKVHWREGSRNDGGFDDQKMNTTAKVFREIQERFCDGTSIHSS